MTNTTLTQSDATSIRNFFDVNETGLLILYARAMESRSEKPILVDEHAERIVDAIDAQIAGANDPFLSMLYNKEVDERLVVHAALRAQKYDQYAQAFLDRHPGSVVANLNRAPLLLPGVEPTGRELPVLSVERMAYALIRQAPAIVGCQTPSALAHSAWS